MERSASDASPIFGRDGPRQPVLPKCDGVLFAPCLDNARRCFLILKYIFFPLSIVLGVIAAFLKVQSLLGSSSSISVFFFINCVIATIIGAPVLLIPAIVRQRRVPAFVRLAASNCLFVSVCLLVPIFTAHSVWRRQYSEVNGFLVLHEYMPAAPPRQRSSVVPAHEPLSVCDDEFFFVLYILDHAFMSVSPYFLPMIIELPRRYFAFTFSAHTLLFWASAVRISNVYVDACTSHPYAGYGAEFVKRYLPLGHMMHLVICVSYLFTRLFVFSRNREKNKARVVLALTEAVSISRVHLEAIFRVNNTPTRIKSAAFWSRTEFLSMSPKQPPLLLPSGVGIAFRVTSGLKDWGLYVWALSLPIYFSVFEIMRLVVDVHPLVCSVMNAYFGKCILFVIGVIAPHYLFAKILHQKRVPSPWFVYSCCFLAIILSVHFIKPGTTRILPRNFRAFPFFIMSNVAPATILRAISHTASAKFIVIAFLALHIASCYSIYHNYWLPYLADRMPRHTDSIYGSSDDSGFFAIFCLCRYILMGGQICVGMLLDQRHHAKITGRKFFEPPATASDGKG